MMFDLKCKSGAIWKWGTNSCSIYRPDGSKLFLKQGPTPPPLEASKGEFRYSEFPGSLEILLGEKCNLNCKYCFQTKMREKGLGWKTGPDDIQPFINLVQNALPYVRAISFWGGEPFVYWKTLKPLVEKLRPAYPLAHFSIVTNGLLLDEEKAKWALKNRVHLCVSCDGPGEMREKSAAEDNWRSLAIAEQVLGDYLSYKPVAGRGCTNSQKTRDWFRARALDAKIEVRSVIRLVPEHELETTLTPKELKEIEESARWDALNGRADIHGLLTSIVSRHTPWVLPGECGLAIGQQIAVNLKGDIFPCHENFSGSPVGNLNDMPGVFVPKAYSPYERKCCRECPAVIACGGGCPREPLDAQPICAGRKARSTGLLRAALEILTGEEIEEIVPHEL